MEIFADIEQGSPEWFKIRMGIPTASEFQTLLSKGRDGGISIGRRTYMLKLAGEVITGQPMEQYTNAHMERGKIMEAEARDFYAFASDVEPTQVGFVRNNNTGCSPDALIGTDGILEIKTALPHILIPHLLKGSFPDEHRAQVQGGLMITQRLWCDLIIYWPGIPLFRARAFRDNAFITRLQSAVDLFNDELHEIIDRVRQYGQPAPTLMETLQASVERLEAGKP